MVSRARSDIVAKSRGRKRTVSVWRCDGRNAGTAASFQIDKPGVIGPAVGQAHMVDHRC